MVKRRSKSIHTEERHHFFKIMFPGFSTRRLRIPPEFVEHISMEAYKFATLEDSNGNHWRVTLNKTTSGTYIEDGWKDFITDQSIYDNNFLVFGYDGNTCFDVNVFDESGCERDYVFSTKPNQEPDFSDEVKSFETSTDYVQKSITDDPGKLFPTFKPKGLKKAKKENVELIHEPLSKTTCSASRTYRKKCSVSRRRPATEEEKAKVQKEAESFTSKFPHFSRCLTAANVYQGFVLNFGGKMGETCDDEHLYWTQFQVKRFCQVLSPGFHRQLSIPTKFVQCLKDDLCGTGSLLCGTAFLRGPSNKTWKLELMGTQDGLVFQNGWSDFVRDHFLEEGNILFFMYKGNLNFDVFVFDHESLCEKPCSYFMCHVSKRRSMNDPSEARGATVGIGRLISRSTKPVSHKRKLKIDEVVELDSSSFDSYSTDDAPEPPLPRPQSGCRLLHESSRRPVTEEEKLKVKQMAMAAFDASLHTSFFVVMRQSHVYSLFYMAIPCNFVKKHFPRRNKDVTLRCNGSRWNVMFLHRNLPAVAGAFTSGWADFVYGNNIEEDDVCLFELVDDGFREENEHATVFNVHIFRVVENIAPLSRVSNPRQHNGRSGRGESSSASIRGRGRGRGRGSGRCKSFFT